MLTLPSNRTYKELKFRLTRSSIFSQSLPIVPTRNWNTLTSQSQTYQLILPIVPTRNWNNRARCYLVKLQRASNRTYKELKCGFHLGFNHRLILPIVPTRNWNRDKRPQEAGRDRFQSYLQGIEIYINEKEAQFETDFQSYLQGIEIPTSTAT